MSCHAPKQKGCLGSPFGTTAASASGVDVARRQRMRFDERAARLDVVAHQRGAKTSSAAIASSICTRSRRHATSGPSWFPTAAPVHFAQALVAQLAQAALGFAAQPLHGLAEIGLKLFLALVAFATRHDGAGADQARNVLADLPSTA